MSSTQFAHQPTITWKDQPKGTYTAHLNDEGKVRTIVIACPNCGTYARLPHRVDSNGFIYPSVWCPVAHEDKGKNKPRCTYHYSGCQLIGWKWGERPDIRDQK